MDKVSKQKPIYQRIILKLSGEALQNDNSTGIDSNKLLTISNEIAKVIKLGVQVAIVIGGGNIIRGADLAKAHFDRVTADQMGMLATVINGLALRETFQRKSIPVQIMSALAVPGLVDFYDRHKARALLQLGQVLIFVGGTGNPLVTTDSAAALRGIEMGAAIVIKATKVDGVFSADPVKNPNSERYTHLTYDTVINSRLGVMDLNAIFLCKDHNIPLRVFNMNNQGDLERLVLGEDVGTLIADPANFA